jgi:Tfp pilus assembly protein PilN
VLAGLILSAPLLTIAGAKLLTGAVEREGAALSAQLAPRIAAQREAEAAHQRLADALRGPGPSRTIEALARTLPAEAKIARLARQPDGAIDIEVAAPDPDRLRSALRRAPEFAKVRDAGQRAGDGEMISRFRIAAP